MRVHVRENERAIVKVDRQGQRNSVAAGRQDQGKAAGASGVNYHHGTIAGMADICLGRGPGSSGRLVGKGERQRQSGGARIATTARGTVTTLTATTGMDMVATGMVTAAIGTVVVALRTAKAALGMVPTGTIAMGIAAVLVPNKGN